MAHRDLLGPARRTHWHPPVLAVSVGSPSRNVAVPALGGPDAPHVALGYGLVAGWLSVIRPLLMFLTAASGVGHGYTPASASRVRLDAAERIGARQFWGSLWDQRLEMSAAGAGASTPPHIGDRRVWGFYAITASICSRACLDTRRATSAADSSGDLCETTASKSPVRALAPRYHHNIGGRRVWGSL